MASTAVDQAKYQRLRASGVPHRQAVAMAALAPTADFSPPLSQATDAEVAAAVATLASTTASDAELAAAVATVNATLASKQDAAAAATALALKAPLASPAFTGTPTKNGSPVQSATDVAGAYPTRRAGTSSTAAPIPFYNVKDYGAAGDGTTDDTAAINSCFAAAAAASPAEVWFPAGTYATRSRPRTSPTTTNSATDGHALVVPASTGLTIRGAGVGTTKIVHRALGGGDPTSVFQTVGGNVWRGGGMFFRSGTTGLTVRDIEMDGQAAYTGLNTFPANPSTGDGWDLTHKGIWFENDGTFDDVLLDNVKVHSYRGELAYYGGANMGRVTGRRLHLYDTNGDDWSFEGEVTLVDSNLGRAGAHCVDDIWRDNKPGRYTGNKITAPSNAGISGRPADVSTDAVGPVLISRNLFMNISQRAVELLYPRNVTVEDNDLTDCATGVLNNQVIYAGTASSKPIRNLKIRRNSIRANTASVNNGVVVADSFAAGVTGLVIEDNRGELTAAGLAAGKTFNQMIDVSTLSAAQTKDVRRNASLGASFGYTDQAVTNDAEIASGGGAIVAQLRPPRQGNYTINVHLRVTATTTVTLLAQWTDPGGTQRQVALENGASKAAGFYNYAPVFCNAIGDTNTRVVKVYAISTVASAAFASVSLLEAL